MMSFSQSSMASLADGSPTYGGKSKLYNDPIHGFFSLSEDVLAFVDTPQFQRLRELKQLGVTSYIFPGATHDRFQHSVGVYHLSARLLDSLASRQPELCLERGDATAVGVAGLCHDLGHGPYSHVFDNEFIPRVAPGVSFSHEGMGLDILDWLIDDNNVEVLDTQGVGMVRDMIMAAKPSAASHSEERDFLYQIVANGKNSIDTDKFDYLARDTYFMGLKSTFDFRRLMVQNRVVQGDLCFHCKEVYSVLELFHTRYTLFKNCYLHRAGKAVEYMITDAMVEANAVWDGRLAKAIQSPQEYCKLTDSIVLDIQHSTDPGLEAARGILQDLRRRRLYRFVDEAIVPAEVAKELRKLTAVDVTTNNPTSVSLTEDDVIVHDLKLNYGNKDRSPLSTTNFYKNAGDTESFLIDSRKVSYLLPLQYEERVIRVYSRRQDRAIHRAIHKAFRQMCRKLGIEATADPSHASNLFKSPAKPVRATAASSTGSRSGSGSATAARRALTSSSPVKPMATLAEEDELDGYDGPPAAPPLAPLPPCTGGSKRARPGAAQAAVADNPWSKASKASKR